MDNFNIHFLKVQSRNLNIELVKGFFEVIEGFTYYEEDSKTYFHYKDPYLGYEVNYVITPKTNIKDIHKLDAKYLDLNFCLEIPIYMPNYFVRKVLKITKQLVERFDFVYYNEFLDNAYPYKEDMIYGLYTKVKRAFLDRKPILYQNYQMVETNKLTDILKYMDEMQNLHKHYQDSNTYIPHYFFFKNSEGKLRIAIEWKENTLTVFPPYIDYVIFNTNNNAEIISADEFFEETFKYLEPVAGFIKGSFVIPKKNLRRINRILRRNKFNKVFDNLTKISHTNLLD